MYPTYPKVETKILIRHGVNGFEMSIESITNLRVEREGVWYDVMCNRMHLGRYTANAAKSLVTWSAELVAEAAGVFNEEVHRHRLLYNIQNQEPSASQLNEMEELMIQEPYIKALI